MNLEPGDHVKILSSGEIGIVLDVYSKKIKLKSGNLIIETKLNNVRKIKIDSRNFKTPEEQHIKLFIHNSQCTSIDLHGYTQEEAKLVLDKFIDNAVVSNHKTLEIIHGRGKGLLKKMIKDVYSKDTRIKKIIENHPFRGGTGVTYFEL